MATPHHDENHKDDSLDNDNNENDNDDDNDTLRQSLCRSNAATPQTKKPATKTSSFKSSLRRTVSASTEGAKRTIARNLSFGSASSAAAAAALAAAVGVDGDDDEEAEEEEQQADDLVGVSFDVDHAPTATANTTKTAHQHRSTAIRTHSNPAPTHVPHRHHHHHHQHAQGMKDKVMTSTGSNSSRRCSNSSGKTRRASVVQDEEEQEERIPLTPSKQQRSPQDVKTFPSSLGDRVLQEQQQEQQQQQYDDSEDESQDYDQAEYDRVLQGQQPYAINDDISQEEDSEEDYDETKSAACASMTPVQAYARGGGGSNSRVLQQQYDSDDGDSTTPVVVLKKPKTPPATRQTNQELKDRSASRRTIRTEVSSSNYSSSDDEEAGRSRRHNYEYDETRSNRSIRSNRTNNRTLAEIRRDKLLQSQPSSSSQLSLQQQQQQQQQRPIVCCGLSRCGWFSIILIGLVGFMVGFLVPLLKANMGGSSDGSSSSPTIDGTNGNGNNDLNNNDGWGGSSQNSTQQTWTPVYTPLDPDESVPGEGDTNNGGGSTYTDTTPAPQEEDEVPIDVWNLFSTATTSTSGVPVASEASIANVDFNEQHLQQAAQHFVQKTIHANIRKPLLRLVVDDQQSSSSSSNTQDIIPFMDTPLSEYDGANPYPTGPNRASASNKYPQGDVSQWESLLKAAGVHESDVLQWDPTRNILYVGHGQHIDVVDTASGTLRTTIKLPVAATTEQQQLLMARRSRESWLLPAESDRQQQQENTEWTPAPPKPFIEQLLLTSGGDNLVVIVSDYTSVHTSKIKPVLQDSLVTQLWTYQLTHKDNMTAYELNGNNGGDGALPHVVHGRVMYAAQATSNQHIHIVTSSQIDTNRLLQDPLERLYFPDDRHDDIYVDEAIAAAREKYIPLYTKRLLGEIRDMGEDDLTLWPLTQWIMNDNAHNNAVLSEAERHLQQLVMGQEHLQELIVVTSLSIVKTNAADASTSAATGISTAAVSTAFLAPASVGVIGSTATKLAFSIPGYQWTTTRSDGNAKKVLQEATHILQLELGTIAVSGTSYRAATRFRSIGAVPGRLILSPRQCTEIRGENLRLATVVTKQWKPATVDGEAVVEEAAVQRNYMNVLNTQTLQPSKGSPLALFEGEAALVSAISFLHDVAYVFPWEPLAANNETNIQVIGFGSSLGDDDDDEASALSVLGSIEPSTHQGFSPFLHTIKRTASQTLLLSVGENRTALGPTLSVWDATDPGQLKPLVRYSLEVPQMLTSWRPQTFRVTPQGQVLLPLTTEAVGDASGALDEASSQLVNMNGFVILDVVSTREIKVVARVAHSPVVAGMRDCVPGDIGCPLEARSFLGPANSMILTVEGGVAKSTIVGGEQVDTEGWTLVLN